MAAGVGPDGDPVLLRYPVVDVDFETRGGVLLGLRSQVAGVEPTVRLRLVWTSRKVTEFTLVYLDMREHSGFSLPYVLCRTKYFTEDMRYAGIGAGAAWIPCL